MVSDRYDMVIVGAGPCGIFAALELMKYRKVAVFDVGKAFNEKSCPLETSGRCTNCKPVCSIIGGFGGAQFFEGTKLSLYPAGTGLLKFSYGIDELKKIYRYVESILEENGKQPRDRPDPEKIHKLEKKFKDVGIEMKYYDSQKVSKKTMNLIANNLLKKLNEGGVSLFFREMVLDIEKQGKEFILKTNNGEYAAGKVILAVGRIGSRWLTKIADKLGIEYDEGDHQVELGVRIEMPYQIFSGIDNVHNDIKLKKVISNVDELRTFCQDYRGFITKCVYNLPDDKIVSSLDGHIIGTDKEGGAMSEVVNIAVHHRFILERRMDDIYSIIDSMNHNGKPIAQSMKSFLLGKPPYNNIRVKLSMPDVVFGDINEYLPLKTLLLIKDFIYKLDRVLPGFAHDNNAVYAPSFEMGWKQMTLSNNFETTVRGIYIGGDVNGHFRGALQAMVSGVIIARNLISKEGENNV